MFITGLKDINLLKVDMVTVENCNSWEALCEKISEILKTIDERRKNSIGGISQPLFRGHACSDWHLRTTLERATQDTFTVSAYHQRACSAHRFLSGFNDSKVDFDEHASCSYESLMRSLVPNYPYWAYLRHHGFPSPLLDWTASPYIAAFFAFEPESNAEMVSIYWFQEYYGNGKAYCSQEPHIQALGPWTPTHKRHFLQQSWYSICIKDVDEEVEIVSHEEAFSKRADEEQDNLVKIVIPRSERMKALRALHKMNINPYSLFQSEESLVRTVGLRLFNRLE